MELKGHVRGINSLSFSPDGRRVLTASQDETARIWDADDGKLLVILGKNKKLGDVRSALFSPDGRRVVTLAPVDHFHIQTSPFAPSQKMKTEDRASVRIWESTSGTELFALPGHLDGDELAVFSPDGKKLLTESDGQVKHTTNFFFGSQWGTTISGAANVGRIWDATSGRQLAVL